jgi:hypothetical protein
MKYKLIAFFIVVTILGCNKDESPQDNNPNLLNPLVNLNLNLNLPEYNPLKFPGNSIIISQQGIKGIVIYNVNNDLYTAFELSDPNHVPSSCSRMTVEGIIASCPCTTDTNAYDIVTGQHTENENLFPMQQYFAQRSGDNVRVTN